MNYTVMIDWLIDKDKYKDKDKPLLKATALKSKYKNHKMQQKNNKN